MTRGPEACHSQLAAFQAAVACGLSAMATGLPAAEEEDLLHPPGTPPEGGVKLPTMPAFGGSGAVRWAITQVEDIRDDADI